MHAVCIEILWFPLSLMIFVFGIHTHHLVSETKKEKEKDAVCYKD
jgi:hypothetical protein